jgi:hypothetical protein
MPCCIGEQAFSSTNEALSIYGEQRQDSIFSEPVRSPCNGVVTAAVNDQPGQIPSVLEMQNIDRRNSGDNDGG